MTDKKIAFGEVLTALTDNSKIFPARYLQEFSHLSEKKLEDLKKSWSSISDERKIQLFQDLEDLAEADTLMDFDVLARFAINDPLGEIRALAIRLLWECESLDLVDIYLKKIHTDPDPDVQATAASALGTYIYRGELEELSEALLQKIVDELLALHKTSPHLVVRRHALESLGYSSHEDIPKLIEKAFRSEDYRDTASALYAMGRSADNRWDKYILANLESSHTDVQLEAVRASGELDIKKARAKLLELVDSGDLDEEVFYAAIWSLSQIGGEGVKAIFEEIMDSEIDDELADFMEKALDNLVFNDGLADFDLFDLDEPDVEAKN